MTDETLGVLIGLILVIVLFFALIIGGVKTFKRNWIAALILLIFLFPIWIIWAIIEVFRGPVEDNDFQFGRSGQNVSVTVVNQTGETSSKNAVVGVFSGKRYFRQFETNNNVETSPRLTGALNEIVPMIDTKVCQYCAEDIKYNAKICRYCNRDV